MPLIVQLRGSRDLSGIVCASPAAGGREGAWHCPPHFAPWLCLSASSRPQSQRLRDRAADSGNFSSVSFSPEPCVLIRVSTTGRSSSYSHTPETPRFLTYTFWLSSGLSLGDSRCVPASETYPGDPVQVSRRKPGPGDPQGGELAGAPRRLASSPVWRREARTEG